MADVQAHVYAVVSYADHLIDQLGPVMRRAIIRARHRYAVAHPDRPRLRRMHSTYRAKTRGRSRRG